MEYQSLDSLFNQYTPVMRSYALALTRDAEEAQDLYQEAAFRACRSFNRFQQGTSFKAWILTLTRNAFLDMCRKRTLNQKLSATVGQSVLRSSSHISRETPDVTLQAKELGSLVSDLDYGLGHPFSMAYDGYDYSEIAQEMSLPLGTVKSRIHFARKALKRQLAV